MYPVQKLYDINILKDRSSAIYPFGMDSKIAISDFTAVAVRLNARDMKCYCFMAKPLPLRSASPHEKVCFR